MKKKIFILLALSISLFSCNDNENKVYTSISGYWHCQTVYNNQRYLTEIIKTQSANTYIISNFENSGYNGYADIRATLKDKTLTLINMSTEEITLHSGTGTVSADYKRISFEYSITRNGQDITVLAIYSR